MTKKLSRVFVSKQETKISKHSAKQSVEILKSSEEIKSWIKCLKNLVTCLSFNTWLCFSNQTKFFFGHTLISYPFFVFMWETARYLQHEKYQCKF